MNPIISGRGRYRLLTALGEPRYHTPDLKEAIVEAEALLGKEDGPVFIKDYHSGTELRINSVEAATDLRWVLETDELLLRYRREIG